MSATVDVNVLMYRTDERSPFHGTATETMARLTAGPELLYLFWPVLSSYLRLATHAGIADRPLDVESAISNVESLVNLPHVRTPAEEPGFVDVFVDTLPGPVRGNDIPDVHLVALMRQHGVETIYTNDRGFRRFDRIRVIDPF